MPPLLNRSDSPRLARSRRWTHPQIESSVARRRVGAVIAVDEPPHDAIGQLVGGPIADSCRRGVNDRALRATRSPSPVSAALPLRSGRSPGRRVADHRRHGPARQNDSAKSWRRSSRPPEASCTCDSADRLISQPIRWIEEAMRPRRNSVGATTRRSVSRFQRPSTSALEQFGVRATHRKDCRERAAKSSARFVLRLGLAPRPPSPTATERRARTNYPAKSRRMPGGPPRAARPRSRRGLPSNSMQARAALLELDCLRSIPGIKIRDQATQLRLVTDDRDNVALEPLEPSQLTTSSSGRSRLELGSRLHAIDLVLASHDLRRLLARVSGLATSASMLGTSAGVHARHGAFCVCPHPSADATRRHGRWRRTLLDLRRWRVE